MHLPCLRIISHMMVSLFHKLNVGGWSGDGSQERNISHAFTASSLSLFIDNRTLHSAMKSPRLSLTPSQENIVQEYIILFCFLVKVTNLVLCAFKYYWRECLCVQIVLIGKEVSSIWSGSVSGADDVVEKLSMVLKNQTELYCGKRCMK